MSTWQAGWYQDPQAVFEHRYWDGQVWTDQVASGGVAATSPIDADPVQASETAASLHTSGANGGAPDDPVHPAPASPAPPSPASLDPTPSHPGPATGPAPEVEVPQPTSGGTGLSDLWRDKPLVIILPGLGFVAVVALGGMLLLSSLLGGGYDPARHYSGGELAALCESGDMRACDRAFWDSPVGSDLELFGGTCGGRLSIGVGSGYDIQWGDSFGPQGSCAALFGDTYGFFDRFRH